MTKKPTMNMAANRITPELLLEILDLDQETGQLFWKNRPDDHFPNGKISSKHRAALWNGKYAGKPALTSKDERGYRQGMISGVSLYAHRVIRAMIDAKWPGGEVDHINRDKTDNRPDNLRVVSHRENRLNTKDVEMAAKRRMEAAPKSKAYPFAGLRRQSKTTWQARIKLEGQEKHLGSFRCFGKAVVARRSAE